MSVPAMASVVDVVRLFSLQGKTAIVTRGTGGLGTAMATALASAGADIVSVEIPADPGSAKLQEAIQVCNRKYTSYECDIVDKVQLRLTFQRMWTEGVTPDIILNCAGVQRRAEAEDFTDEDIDLVIDVNLKATYVACQEFAKKIFADRRRGRVINIASIISYIGGKNVTPYAASKGGVMQVTKAMSNEWAEKGIQCNCIHPGYFRTPMTEQYSTDPKYKNFNNYILGRVPTKRWGDPVDLSGAVIFLASPASDYITGSSIVVDGGFMGM